MKRTLFAMAIAALAACDAGKSDGSVRDSANVGIASAGPIATTAPPVDSQALFDVGGTNDDEALEFNAGTGYPKALPLSDGGAVSIDDFKVRFFTAAGKQDRVAGRFGAGPNEFRHLTHICVTRGDTVLVFDAGNQRISVLDRDGKSVYSYVLPGASSLPERACFGDGTFIAGAGAVRIAGKPAQLLKRFRLDGTFVNEVGVHPTHDYTTNPEIEVSVIAQDSTFAVGDPSADEIRRYNAQGTLLSVLRISDARDRSPEGNRTPQAYRAAGTSGPPIEERAIKWPVFRNVLLDSDGAVWVETQAHETKGPAVWSKYDWSGKSLMTVSFPPTSVENPGRPTRDRPANPLHFDQDHVLVMQLDGDGAVHYRRLKLRS